MSKDITAEDIAEVSIPKLKNTDKALRGVLVTALALAIESYKDIHVERAIKETRNMQ